MTDSQQAEDPVQTVIEVEVERMPEEESDVPLDPGKRLRRALTPVLIGMGIVFFYAVIGGMKGITYTQVAQYCVLIFAYTVPAVFISLQVTETPIPQLAFGSSVADGGGFLLVKLDRVVTELGFSAYTSGSKSRVRCALKNMEKFVPYRGLSEAASDASGL